MPSSSIGSLKPYFLTLLIALMAWTSFHLAIPLLEHTQSTIIPRTEGQIALYSTQAHDDLSRLHLDAIHSAKESVMLIIYGLNDPQILYALKEKSDEGIPVTIYYDPEATKDLRRRIPKATLVEYKGEGLMHQKILIVDNSRLLLGSANMTGSSLNLHHNLVMQIDNPSIAQAFSKRVAMLLEKRFPPLFVHEEISAEGQQAELWVLPDDPEAVQRILSLIHAARKTIKVAMYAWTRYDFAQALVEAKERGVEVEIILDRFSGKGAGSKVIRLLEQGGIPVRLSSGGRLMHNKFALIDDRVLVNGSANWTMGAFQKNNDFFVILNPLLPQQQAKLKKVWSALVKDSERLPAASF